MPEFSIIVLAYQVEDYLSACLDSLVFQSFKDWEAIVVVDASPDNSAEVARRYANVDGRFKVVEKTNNEGTHLARRTGALQASGEWTTFLDGDDELMPTALEELRNALKNEPCDLLRFGVTVERAGASEAACKACEQYANRPLERCTGKESLRLTFDEAGGYQQDWRAWSNVVRTSVAKQAFSAMTTDRLGRSQDSYEFFVLLSFVNAQVTRTDIRGYRYFFGRGVSGTQSLSVEKFTSYAEQFASVFNAMQDYANAYSAYDMSPAARGGRIKLIEMLFTDWRNRVCDSDKIPAARMVAPILGPGTVASELERIVRDEAYDIWVSGGVVPDDAPLLAWHTLAQDLATGIEPSARYEQFSNAAVGHLRDLEKRKQLESRKPERFHNAMASVFARFRKK